MKIGVLGTGDVGRRLGAGFAGRGHQVMLGTRDPASEKVRNWIARTGHGVSAGRFADAAAFGDAAVLAVSWQGLENVIHLAGPDNLSGKLVMDTTNPLVSAGEGKPPALGTQSDESAGELVQKRLPRSKVVKAFNMVGNAHMVDPEFPGGKPDMFIAGNDAAAKKTAAGLIEQLGWPPPIDLGDITMSRHLESLAMVWIVHFFNSGFNPNHAFKLLRK